MDMDMDTDTDMNMNMNRQMSFTWSTATIFLFGSWETGPDNEVMYYLALGGVFILSIVSQILRSGRSKLEKTAVKTSYGKYRII